VRSTWADRWTGSGDLSNAWQTNRTAGQCRHSGHISNLVGGPRTQRANLVTELDALPVDAPRILLATGRLVGEGFDHPPLDNLILAMPLSWKGTLQQYAGRLPREHANKTDVRVIDFVDTAHAALLRMWEKRQRGYRAMGYRIAEPSA